MVLRTVSFFIICFLLVSCAPTQHPLEYAQPTVSTYRIQPIISYTQYPIYYHHTQRWYDRQLLILPHDMFFQFLPAFCSQTSERCHFARTSDEYVILQRKAVLKAYEVFWRKLFEEYGIRKLHYTFQCAAWCQAFLSYLELQHYVTNQPHDNNAQTIACGIVWYMPDRGELGHSVIGCVEARERVLSLWWFDPLLGYDVTLSKTELQSIYYVRF